MKLLLLSCDRTIIDCRSFVALEVRSRLGVVGLVARMFAQRDALLMVVGVVTDEQAADAMYLELRHALADRRRICDLSRWLHTPSQEDTDILIGRKPSAADAIVEVAGDNDDDPAPVVSE